MLCANIIDNEIILTKDINNLATYDELLEELCLGNLRLSNMTMVKEGIIVLDKDECEMDFIRFRN